MDRRILVVDDQELFCRQLVRLLARPDRQIKVAHDGTTALELLIEGHFSLLLTDMNLPGVSGLDIIREVHDRNLPLATIAMTGYGSINSAVEAMQLGAYDYLTKPLDHDRLQVVVEKALNDRTLHDEVLALREGLRQRYGFHNLIGKSAPMREVFETVEHVASSSCPVLIMGETGTGKELVAQAIHQADATRRGPLIAVNCAALPETLLESELFGHEKGAFTGAERQKKGRFELAQGGTLFLDEIGELPLPMQAKLLRVLQDGQFERVGGNTTIRTKARVLAATNLDLAAAVAAKAFREDLYYRLNVVGVTLPPLRDRSEDIPLLIDHILDTLEKRRIPRKQFARETLARLCAYDWPGNVRELEHLVEQVAVTTPGPVIEVADLPSLIQAGESVDSPFDLGFDPQRKLQDITDELTERIERAYLERVLEKYRGRINPCADHCGLSRRSISEKLRRYRIDKADFKPHSSRSRQTTADPS
jgi:two-component system NtrC family response regulator